MLKSITQKDRDKRRKDYIVVFPPNMPIDMPRAWLNMIAGGDQKLGGLVSRPTTILELHGKNFGLEHRIRVPEPILEHLISQLRGQIHGVTATPANASEPIEYTYGVEVTMNNGARTLRIDDLKKHTNGILHSMMSLRLGEHVTLQWIISPTSRTKVPPSDKSVAKSRNTIWEALTGNLEASRDEVADLQAKARERSFNAVGRIAARAESEDRARELVEKVKSVLIAQNTNHARFNVRRVNPSRVSAQIADGETPAQFHATLGVSELIAVSGWPIDQPFMAGLPMGMSRPLPANPSIPSDALIPLGMSSYPGGERRLSLSALSASSHVWVPGETGTGKSTWLGNAFATVVAAGHGAITIDQKKDMALSALDYVPYERLNDVIYMNPMDTRSIVGFNPLDQGRSSAAIDEIIALFGHLYPNVLRDVYARQLLHHGLHALHEAGQITDRTYTLLDLPVLLNPQFPEEKAWAAEVKRTVTDRSIKKFFSDWDKLQDRERLMRYNALDNKFWQFDRPELRYVIGQSKSAFQMRDVIMGNKILIVNTVGMNDESQKLLIALLMQALWGAVRQDTPDKENFLFLDEFADIVNIPVSFEAMLAKARSAKLPMFLANQNFDQIDRTMLASLRANARTTIAFKLSAEDSAKVATDMAPNVRREDLTNLPAHHAYARVNTPSGVSSPASITTFAPFDKPGLGAQVERLSQRTYGRPLAAVTEEMDARRTPTKKQTRRPLGEASIDDEE